jgi:hypothetical protein
MTVMQKLLCGVVLLVGVAGASTAAAQELTLTIANGRATLIATDVPLRQVIAEWARVGNAKVVNGERLVGPNLTIQLVDRPEREVLDAILRSAAGYVAAARTGGDPHVSMYDRVLILPTSQAPAFNPVATSTPTFTPPRPMPMPMPVPVEDDDPPDQPVVLPPGTAAVPGAMPVPAGATAIPGMVPQQVPATQSTPGMPQTLPQPGMLPQPAPMMPNPYVPNPAQQPTVRPGTVVRPPGGPGGEDRDDRVPL